MNYVDAMWMVSSVHDDKKTCKKKWMAISTGIKEKKCNSVVQSTSLILWDEWECLLQNESWTAAKKNEKCDVLDKCRSNVGCQDGPERGKVQYMPKDTVLDELNVSDARKGWKCILYC